MSAGPLLHVALRADLEAAAGAMHYAPAGLEPDGFVHLCRPDQLAGVLERYLRDRDDLVLLMLDPGAFDAPLVEEDTTGRGETFPHLYGAIPLAAVRGARPLRTDPAGALIAEAAPPAGDAAASDPAALEAAAQAVVEAWREGAAERSGATTDPAIGARLHGELVRRCPGRGEIEYVAALAAGLLAMD